MKNGQRSCMVTIWLLLMCGTGFFTLLAFGSQRYGGISGLTRRVQVEVQTQVNQFRPRPEFVPAPAVMPTVDANLFATQLQTATPEPQPQLVTSTQLSIPTPLPTPTAAYQPAAPAVELYGFRHMWQTWNNCGPATLATNLSFFKHNLDQAQVAAVLKPNPDDKNVNPAEMVAFAQAQGFQARAFVNGDYHRLKLLVSNNIPVLIETWLEPKPNDGLGHYRLLVGYDDSVREWIFSDSYVGAGVGEGPYRGIRVSYDKMDPLWAVFNRTYIVIYPDSVSSIVQGIIGPDMSHATMWQNSFNRFKSEIQTNPQDPFAWFNMGTTLATMGQYDQAAVAYDQARTLGLPWRMLWYQFGIFQTYYEVGRYQELIDLAEVTIEAGGEIEEIYYWKGRAFASLNNLDTAKNAWEQALVINPSYRDATTALVSIGAR